MFASETTGPSDRLSGENEKGQSRHSVSETSDRGGSTHPGHLERRSQPRPPPPTEGLEGSSFQKAGTRNRKLLPFLSILSQHFLFGLKKHSLSVTQPFPCPGQPQALTHPPTSAFLLDCSACHLGHEVPGRP